MPIFVALVSIIVLFTSIPAVAGDMCLDLGGCKYVGKGFTKPSKGKCKPWQGFVREDPGICPNGTTTGVACVNAAGTELRLALTTTSANGVFFDDVRIPLPSFESGTDKFFSLGSATPQTFTAKHWEPASDCPPTSIP